MALIEQAILITTSAGPSPGCQVVAASPGICEADRQELIDWGPARSDLLLESGPDAASLNFHPLPSGAYCISRTTLMGEGIAPRPSDRLVTHCLVLWPETLEQFANHPFAVAKAVWGDQPERFQRSLPSVLEPMAVVGSRPIVDQPTLAQLAEQVGPWHMAMLVQATVNSACLSIAGPATAEQLISGVLDCLPPGHRPTVSFSTGLKFTPHRMFRLFPLPRDPASRRWLSQQPYVTILDLAQQRPSSSLPVDNWARMIERVLAKEQISFLAKELAKQPSDIAPRSLSALGRQLLTELDGPSPGAAAQTPLRAHAAHRVFEKSEPAAMASVQTIPLPSEQLAPDSPELADRLGDLDDAVFDAINGCPGAIDRLKAAWPKLRAELGDALLSESREQYLRYALSIWEQCIEHDSVHNPSRAVDALEVLCVLFDEV